MREWKKGRNAVLSLLREWDVTERWRRRRWENAYSCSRHNGSHTHTEQAGYYTQMPRMDCHIVKQNYFITPEYLNSTRNQKKTDLWEIPTHTTPAHALTSPAVISHLSRQLVWWRLLWHFHLWNCSERQKTRQKQRQDKMNTGKRNLCYRVWV